MPKEGATLSRDCSLETYLTTLSFKQGGIKYHFWVFGMTQPEIEPYVSWTIGERSFSISSLKDSTLLLYLELFLFCVANDQFNWSFLRLISYTFLWLILFSKKAAADISVRQLANRFYILEKNDIRPFYLIIHEVIHFPYFNIENFHYELSRKRVCEELDNWKLIANMTESMLTERRRARGVMDYAVDCDFVVSMFKLQSLSD